MSTKPLAEVVMHQDHGDDFPYGIDINGERLLTEGAVVGDDITDVATAINKAHEAAVEQREAKLRDQLGLVRTAVNRAFQRIRERTGGDVVEDLLAISDIVYGHTDAVSGHVACGLAFDIGAEQSKVCAMQAAVDLLDARESMTAEMVCAYLEAAGLKRPKTLSLFTPSGRAELDTRHWQDGDSITIAGTTFRIELR